MEIYLKLEDMLSQHGKITLETRLVDDLEMDSLDMAELEIFVDTEYDVIFEAALVPVMFTVSDLVKHIVKVKTA